MKLKNSLIKVLFFIFFVNTLTFPALFGAEDTNPLLPLPSPQAIYVLSEHLSEADAVVSIENKESRKGNWENDSFSFYGLDKAGNIQVISESAENQNWQSIQMNSLQGANRVLRFLNVPTGSTMNFYYKTALDKASKQNVYIYVLIQAGEKNIARFRVTCNQEGWQKQWIPLGILRLFNRTFPLTITILGDKTHQTSFQFYSEIYQ